MGDRCKDSIAMFLDAWCHVKLIAGIPSNIVISAVFDGSVDLSKS